MTRAVTIAESFNSTVAVGTIIPASSSAVPTGYLPCNGGQYAITDYGDLHSVIGTTWGALTDGSGGSGTTHFVVPNLNGAFLRGTGTGVISGVNKAGETVGQFQVDEMKRHTGSWETASPGHTGQVKIYENVTAPSVTGSQPAVIAGQQGSGYRFTFSTTSAGHPFSKLTIDIGENNNETRCYNASVKYCIKY